METKTSLKKLDLNKKTFIANGRIYRIDSELSIKRFAEYQILEKEAGFGINFKTIFNSLKQIHKLMNEVKFVEASVKLDNLMRGVAKIDERKPTLLKMCALFINREDEDITEINNSLMEEKINDWKEYDVNSFFQFALATIDGFIEVYKNAMELISDIDNENQNK